MRKFLFLFICLILYNIQSFSQKIEESDYYTNNTDLGGDVVINKSTKEIIGDKSIVSFEIESPAAGEYNARFWLFPTKLSDGTFANYEVSVNGNLLTDKIMPVHGDWQSVALSRGGKITLNKGINSVSVIGGIPDVPNVEHVRLSLNVRKAKINSEMYDLYKSAVVRESSVNVAEDALLTTMISSDTILTNDAYVANTIATTRTNDPLYNFTCKLNVGFAVVALWAKVSSSGDRYYTHASVRKGADNNAHGYDWESKPGAMMRTFHPRDALNESLYGQIVEYYKKSDTSVSAIATLEEEIADGVAQIEYVDFDSDENEFIARKINSINSDVLSQFSILYNKWKAVTENTVYSNPEQIASCQEYTDVLNLCKSESILLYAIYEKLGNGDDIAAIKLIEDLTLKDNLSVMKNVREGNAAIFDRAKIKAVRPIHSNFVAYVKELLAKDSEEMARARNMSGKTTGISYSNFADFSVSSSMGMLSVNFSLKKSAKVSLSLLDLSGNNVCSALNEKSLDKGNHSFHLLVSNRNVYLVQLIIDGHINIKKIVVN